LVKIFHIIPIFRNIQCNSCTDHNTCTALHPQNFTPACKSSSIYQAGLDYKIPKFF